MHYSKEEKSKRLEEWRQSGKSAWAYAKENGLVPQTFAKWTKEKREDESCLVAVPTRISRLACSEEIIIERADLRIHLPLSIGSVGLRTVFDALRCAE